MSCLAVVAFGAILLSLASPGFSEITVEPLRCYHCAENENCNENLGIASPCRSVYDRCATFYDSATADHVSARGCSSVNQQGCFEDYSGEYICACATSFCNDFAVSSVAVDSLTDLRNAYHLWNGKVPTKPKQLTPIPIARSMFRDSEEEQQTVEAKTEAPVKEDFLPEKPLSLAAKLTMQSINQLFKSQERDIFPPVAKTPSDPFLSRTAGNSQESKPLLPANVQASPQRPPPESQYSTRKSGLQFPKMSPNTKSNLLNLGKTMEEFLNPESRPGNNLVSPVYNAEGMPINFVAPSSQVYTPPTPNPVVHRVEPVHKFKPVPHPTAPPIKPVSHPKNTVPAPLKPQSYQVVDKTTESAVLTLPPGLLPGFGRNVQQQVPNIAVVVVPPVVANVPVEKPEPPKTPKYQQPQEAVRYVPIEVQPPKPKFTFKSALKSAVDRLLS